MLQRLKMLSLFQPTVVERLLGSIPSVSLTRRDNALGNVSHLSYNATRLEIERPIMVVADVKLDGRASRPSS